MNILLVEDEKKIVDFVCCGFREQGVPRDRDAGWLEIHLFRRHQLDDVQPERGPVRAGEHGLQQQISGGAPEVDFAAEAVGGRYRGYVPHSRGLGAGKGRGGCVRFLGVDLGWVNGATGLAALEFRDGALHLVALELAADHEAVLAWVRAQAGDGPALVAVDAPTIIRNPSGQRPGERLLNSAFRKYGLGCHPANLGRPFAGKTNAFAAALEAMPEIGRVLRPICRMLGAPVALATAVAERPARPERPWPPAGKVAKPAERWPWEDFIKID